jgi:hypothetical protein
VYKLAEADEERRRGEGRDVNSSSDMP